MTSRFLVRALTITLLALLTSFSFAQTRYSVETLPAAGGSAGQGNSINNRGWVTGLANFNGDNFSVGALWINGNLTQLGTLGGPNSAIEWPVKNVNGVIAGISETAAMDLLGENGSSCQFFFPTTPPDGHACQGFRWENGIMTALPTLGGTNSYATGANNRGQIVGWAENNVHDPTCSSDSNQVLQFRAVIWGPTPGQIQELPPLPGTGDTVTSATAINDEGQVVGISGICDIAFGRFSARHAVLWENGVPVNLGSLGGVAWNTPTAINNQGTVVGFSDVPGDQDGTPNFQAFIWTKSTGIQPLPMLPGEPRSGAFGINDKGQIAGLAAGPGNPQHAVLWENGRVFNLNDLTVSGSPLLLYANDINDAGAIAGGEDSGEAYMAIPTDDDTTSPDSENRLDGNTAMTDSARRMLHAKWGANLNYGR